MVGLAAIRHLAARAASSCRCVEDDGLGSTDQHFATHSATIQGHPGAAGAAAVGAAFYFQTPQCGTSPGAARDRTPRVGGAPILFDTSGIGWRRRSCARSRTSWVRTASTTPSSDSRWHRRISWHRHAARPVADLDRRLPERPQLSEFLRHLGGDAACGRHRGADAAGESIRDAVADLSGRCARARCR